LSEQMLTRAFSMYRLFPRNYCHHSWNATSRCEPCPLTLVVLLWLHRLSVG